LILEAQAAGELSAEDAAVYRVFAAFDDDRLPAEFQTENIGWEDHLATREAAGMWDQLSVEQREQIAPYFIPPIYAGSWADPEPAAANPLTAQLGQIGARAVAAVDPKDCASEQLRNQFYVNVPAAGGKVRIWWRNGVDTSARAGQVASLLVTEIDTNIWPKLTGLMGREPLSDQGVGCFNGEDGALDIYITDRTLPGYAHALTLAYPGACTGTPAFIIFDQPRAGHDYGTMDPAKLQAWQYAHEIFHAIQFAYSYGGPCSAFQEMDEATAMWAAEHVYPTEQFEWDRYGEWFRSNGQGLYPQAGYGAWPLFSSITKRHGNERIRLLYEAAQSVSGSYDAIEVIVPGGIDGYWPQFVRDLWDDHADHNVWADWDPGGWTSRAFDAGQQRWADIPYPSGGGLLTLELGPERGKWHVAPWSANPCQLPREVAWMKEYETIGRWRCPLLEGDLPPAVASYERKASINSVGRVEHEYSFADEDWPRYISIEQPGLGVEADHLSVQGFYRLADGSWSGPHDWSTEDEVSFCRDEVDQDVARVVILYGNSEAPGNSPVFGADEINGTYNLEVREACPVGYRIEGSLVGDFPGVPSTTLTFAGVADQIDPEDPSRITGEGTMSGTTIDFCYASGDLETKQVEVSYEADFSVSISGDEITASLLPRESAFTFVLGRFSGPLPLEGGTSLEFEAYEEFETSGINCGRPGTIAVEFTVTPLGAPPRP
jgi:hypothetical protein